MRRNPAADSRCMPTNSLPARRPRWPSRSSRNAAARVRATFWRFSAVPSTTTGFAPWSCSPSRSFRFCAGPRSPDRRDGTRLRNVAELPSFGDVVFGEATLQESPPGLRLLRRTMIGGSRRRDAKTFLHEGLAEIQQAFNRQRNRVALATADDGGLKIGCFLRLLCKRHRG